jgi:hypothetical protein
MVKKVRISNEILYVCERCGLRYREKVWAERCEDFCTRYNACSIEIAFACCKRPRRFENLILHHHSFFPCQLHLAFTIENSIIHMYGQPSSTLIFSI